MRKLNVLMILALCVGLVPAVASAGEDVGACYVVAAPTSIFTDGATEGEETLAGCADGFTEEECTSVDELTSFWPNGTCEDVADEYNLDWDGSCAADIDPIGDMCIVLWTSIGGPATQALCENDIGGVWFDDLVCGGAPVPTMPGIGMAAMVVLLLGGALVLLTIRGTLPSA